MGWVSSSVCRYVINCFWPTFSYTYILPYTIYIYTGLAHCTAVVCPVLSAPKNGFITYSEEASPTLGFMETAAYSCNVGYGLSGGDRVRTCVGPAGSSGEWSGTAPTCQREIT